MHFFRNYLLPLIRKPIFSKLLYDLVYSLELTLSVLLYHVFPHLGFAIVILLFGLLHLGGVRESAAHGLLESPLVGVGEGETVVVGIVGISIVKVVIVTVFIVVKLGKSSIFKEMVEINLLLIFFVFVNVGLVLSISLNISHFNLGVRTAFSHFLFLWLLIFGIIDPKHIANHAHVIVVLIVVLF